MGGSGGTYTPGPLLPNDRTLPVLIGSSGECHYRTTGSEHVSPRDELPILIKWNRQNPVNQADRRRNDKIEQLQHTRKPDNR